jgi:hypothetical protein
MTMKSRSFATAQRALGNPIPLACSVSEDVRAAAGVAAASTTGGDGMGYVARLEANGAQLIRRLR